eukprot:PLAT4283.1.p1 GENE.PLAT4283.1~~PLAT4283.1.p1  ORF type:complete len:341 (+),score=141.09 PLAT4283.1:46-1023(+)
MASLGWLPLESNPDVFNDFLLKAGVLPLFGFSDVVSLDDEMLSFIPQPCLAICFLYGDWREDPRVTTAKERSAAEAGVDMAPPPSEEEAAAEAAAEAVAKAVADDGAGGVDVIDEFAGGGGEVVVGGELPAAEDAAEDEKDGAVAAPAAESAAAAGAAGSEADGKVEEASAGGPFFIKQYVRNACGTIAILHALGNHRDMLCFDEEGPVKTFLDSALTLSPEERGKLLQNSVKLMASSDSAATEKSQTKAPDRRRPADFHFVCITHVDGELYLLDGTKSAPVPFGATTGESFVMDAARLIRTEYIAKGSGKAGFSALSFGLRFSD